MDNKNIKQSIKEVNMDGFITMAAKAIDELEELERLAEIGKAVEWAFDEIGCHMTGDWFMNNAMTDWEQYYFNEPIGLVKAYRKAVNQ